MLTRMTATCLLAGLATGASALTTPGASIFEFNLAGWSDGGVLTGMFEAEDLDGDNQISSFRGEVYDFSATYQSAQLGTVTFGMGAITGPDITGLVYNLDGLGTIGDSTFGDTEGLGITSGDVSLYIGVGPGPVELCDGVNSCAVARSLGGGFVLEEVIIDEVITDEIISDTASVTFATNTGPIIVTSGPLGEFSGEFETNPLAPVFSDDDGGFVFLVDGDIVGEEIFFIDPIIAVGYTYTVADTVFTGVQAPSLAAVADGDGLYTLSFGGNTVSLAAGEYYTFDPADMITTFEITGIDEALMLDPSNTTAFVTGISVDSIGGTFNVTQTPLTIDTLPAVPLPAGGLMLLAGIAGLARMRRSA